MLKKSSFIFATCFFVLTMISPILAHDGDGGTAVVEGAGNNGLLLGISALLAVVMFGVAYVIPDNHGKSMLKIAVVSLATL